MKFFGNLVVNLFTADEDPEAKVLSEKTRVLLGSYFLHVYFFYPPSSEAGESNGEIMHDHLLSNIQSQVMLELHIQKAHERRALKIGCFLLPCFTNCHLPSNYRCTIANNINLQNMSCFACHIPVFPSFYKLILINVK